MRTLDLNADLGEGFGVYEIGDDSALLCAMTSANIACGFHAGDFAVMRRTVAQAQASGVRIGAHPGYPDRYGFGRRTLSFTPEETAALVVYQIGALQALARAAGGRVEHVKLHGALYHDVSYQVEYARAVLAAVQKASPELSFIAPFGSPFVALAIQTGVRVEEEFFADREYERDGRLTPRDRLGAVLADEQQIAQRVVTAWQDGYVRTRTGEEISVRADTVCLHGDHQGAVQRAVALRRALIDSGIPVGRPHLRVHPERA
ncbi:MAG: LamB/YcsF family protein [Firmicutes bacterium]|nr:LamB/YcsF family protein [Bacillota bacterium]